MSIAQKYLYEVIQKKRCISTGLETKPDRQSSTHAGVQETLSTKLREEIQQLRMNHDSKHHEIDTEVRTKDPRRAMEQVLELDEANETVRWSSRPCKGRPEGSGRTLEQPALLVSNSEQCADACVNYNITHADRTAAREQEIQSSKEALRSSNPEWRCAVPRVRLRRAKVQQAESEVLINRNSCSIHSRRISRVSK